MDHQMFVNHLAASLNLTKRPGRHMSGQTFVREKPLRQVQWIVEHFGSSFWIVTIIHLLAAPNLLSGTRANVTWTHVYPDKYTLRNVRSNIHNNKDKLKFSQKLQLKLELNLELKLKLVTTNPGGWWVGGWTKTKLMLFSTPWKKTWL